jgi:uncharacterized protein
MSAFDDEFGLFGDEEKAAEEERTSTLGARRIASDEAAHDDIEPEDERPRRGPRGDRRDRSGGGNAASAAQGGGGDFERRPRRDYGGDRGARKTEDPAVAQKRALDLLGFLARKLVSKPDSVLVEEVDTDKGPVVELVVEHEDLGKVIGRSGRVAQALRTLVRASAEGRISIDIISFEDEVIEQEAEHTDPSLTDADRDAPGSESTEVVGAYAFVADGEEREGIAEEVDEQRREADSDDAASAAGVGDDDDATAAGAKGGRKKSSAAAKSGAKKTAAGKSGAKKTAAKKSTAKKPGAKKTGE